MSRPDPTTTADDSRAGEGPRRSPVAWAALAFGIVFLLVGVAGFVPALLSPDGLEMAGTGSHAMLLGLFQVSVLHNVVHLLFGVAGIAAAARTRTARTYLLVGGVVYLVLLVYGLFLGGHSSDIVPVNSADNWLHAVLGVVMIAASRLLPGGARGDGSALDAR